MTSVRISLSPLQEFHNVHHFLVEISHITNVISSFLKVFPKVYNFFLTVFILGIYRGLLSSNNPHYLCLMFASVFCLSAILFMLKLMQWILQGST